MLTNSVVPLYASVAFALFLSPRAIAQHWATPTSPDQSAVQLLAAGDQLADRQDYSGALLQYRDAYTQIVAELRELEFNKPVSAQLMTRNQLHQRMSQLIADEFTDEDIRLMDRALKAFGMVPPQLDLRHTFEQLYAEEVAGFYDSKSKDLVLIQEPVAPKKKRGFLSRLFGTSGQFDKDEQKAVMAHEMAHALQDQNFDLERMFEAVKHDDDMSIALSALIEGDAMVVMFADMRRDDGDPARVLRMPPRAIDFAFGLVRAFLPFGQGPTFRKAPRILQEHMLFPYHKGMVFVLSLANRGGWESISAAFRDPPTSTEQILHPPKYLGDQRDEPTVVKLPDLADAVGDKWKCIGDNVMGELQIRVMLSSVSDAAEAAAGWDGDQYRVFENVQEQVAIVWYSTWDSETDAKQFAEAYAMHLNGRLNDDGQVPPTSADESTASVSVSDTATNPICLEHEGRTFHIQCQQSDVLVVEGLTKEKTERVLEDAMNARKTPKQFKLQAVSQPSSDG